MALFSKKSSSDAPRRRTQSRAAVERATQSSLDERYTFKRNRTLTGSLSSQVASTSESKAQLKSPRVHAHELTTKRRHLGAVLLLVLASAAILYGLIAQFTAGVVVKAQDLSVQLDPGYEEAIQSYFATRPIERLRFLVNTEQLNDYVQAKTPEIASVKVNGSAGFGKSRFVVVMREPIAGWSINGRQQYVDSSGVPFERNYFSSPQVQIVDNSGVQIQAGQAVASNRFLAFVGRAVGLTKTQGFKVTQVIIPSGTTRQVELRLGGIGYPIKLSVDRAAGEQVEDMARTLRWLNARKITPQYLDVRVSGKAYYR
ncbi:MAG TPA: hypothetical protein VK502_01325 [Candidatus Saccharimonadales bacterium]|nr:hypothetical protein [Candidatus Saccharimonadales bacterium]